MPFYQGKCYATKKDNQVRLNAKVITGYCHDG